MSASKFTAALAILVTWGLAGRPGPAENQASRSVDEVTNGRLSIGPWTSENEARTLALRLKPVRRSGP